MAYCENCLLHRIGEKCPGKTYFVCRKCVKESGDFLSNPPFYTKLFSEGDTVLITRKEKDFAYGWQSTWEEGHMDKFIGQTGKITRIIPEELSANVYFKKGNETWCFPLWVLKKQEGAYGWQATWDEEHIDKFIEQTGKIIRLIPEELSTNIYFKKENETSWVLKKQEEKNMLQDAKVGDRVKCVLNGWGKITNVEQYRKDKIFEVKFDNDKITETVCYHSDGKLNLNHLHPAIIEHVPQKWEPELGIYQITTTGFVVCRPNITTEHKKALKREATTFKTKKQIEIVRDSTRVLRRQFAWLFEHFPEQDGQWSKETMYSVSYDLEEKEYIVSEDFDAIMSETTVYMSEEASKMLVKQLNQGAVEL